MSKKKVLLAFYSGAGSTKTIAEVLLIKLQKINHEIDLLDIDVGTDVNILNEYDFIIFGTPTYHCYPPKTVSEFISKIKYQTNIKHIYLFATYGLYVGNNLRMIAKEFLNKNIQTVGFTGFKSPASDATLLFPTFIKMMYHYKSSIKNEITGTVNEIDRLLKSNTFKTKIPFYKWYAPLDWLPNKFYTARKFHKDYKPNIKVIIDRWDGKEIDCPRNCWEIINNKPKYNPDNCEFCLRCIHRTQNKAVIFSNSMEDRERLDKGFYDKLKQELLE